ncbi:MULTISPECIES: flagellar motor protein MotB [Variovorax]|jgi:chemotaxis protein MotB|uniref:flagellar motor protein MotB n=1 Tax=Variovorax TaxID=34072 RepID=UPI00086E6FFE|nr:MULTISPECIES: flagellar motor protein MotB [Variovorax]MBN8757143.1 flagellar motor protein MotB [Variovorax sp.]ODU17897.1 MAG: flagellar motor protein MotB [Variovorax sp. SCN 67-85]ODV24432.1 MAG: flagellar motor protein MotB [Variovorax sp. SCN 67-20]OJZ13628.1 MAG: flagellar motor protein MotB [Variovorax sp. 67-131]UKI06284.1 flagellar motor protein MotB [Variovorax paradoxus]
MSEGKPQIIIKHVHKGGGGGHHGGGWKIAYADFMTAMMAFFLVMWLLSISSPKQREGIAEHFRMPLRVAMHGGDKASLSNSMIPGGGADVMHVEGEVKQADAEEEADATRLAEMKKKLDELIEKSPVFQQFRSQILIDITTEGLRLQIVDTENRPMFELASARVVPHMRAILRELAPALNGLPNKLTLSGHTDAIVYNNDRSYGNWELSADRANASRRELVVGGLTEGKVLRVIGLADSMHLDRAEPRNPINRRISIILLNRRTQERIERENSSDGGSMRVGKLTPAGAAPKAAAALPAQTPAPVAVTAPVATEAPAATTE